MLAWILLAGTFIHSPGPHASACVPVKCWVPEKERSLGWVGDAADCRPVGAGLCVRQKCCGFVWGPHRSGRGGLLRGVTPAPGYSVRSTKEQRKHECLMWPCVCVRALRTGSTLTVQGLTVSALLIKWNCSIPACREGWGGEIISTSCSSLSCFLLSCLLGITHRW